MYRFISQFTVALVLVVAYSSHASEESMGPKGINSISLGLNGMGVAIGQVEGFRPGKFNYDNAANCCNDKVVPTGVFARNRVANVNEEASGDHELWVASVMISKQTEVDPNTGMSPPIGVAQEAALYSAAYITDDFVGILQQDAAVAAQHLAKTLAETSPFVKVRAINMSFGLELDDSSNVLDGSSTLTQFLDWSTRVHDVLYVVAGNELGAGISVPTDNFNGITVTASRKTTDGFYRLITTDNRFGDDVDAVGDRTSTDIVAPGFLIDVAGPNGTQPPRGSSTGTSMAAPHVTGTVALLQQRAVGLSITARQPEVMKAVILNSADKIIDDGIFVPPGETNPVPRGKLLGMERTVLKSNGTSTWFNSDAHTDDNIPLDREMGAGHLNAKRAFQQLDPGRIGPGSVPRIGWDFRAQNDPGGPAKYILPQLSEDDFVSITLAWDRDVVLNSASQVYQPGNEFVDFGFKNLDLHLLPAGSTDKSQAIASSTSTAWNLEHIFASVPATGRYEIWVVLNQEDSFTVQYALAWWAGGPAPNTASQGDFNGDSIVDDEDYDVWVQNFGSSNFRVDGNEDGAVDAADYVIWRHNYDLELGSGSGIESVPEPGCAVLLAVAGVVMASQPRRGGAKLVA